MSQDSGASKVQRPGVRQGATSELTTFWKVIPGHEPQLRAVIEQLGAAPEAMRRHAGMLIGTLHERRWVLFDDDTRLMFCTSYDGEWDPYLEAFAEHNSSTFEAIFAHIEGYPPLGMQDPGLLDYVVAHQITATEYTRFYDGTVTEVIKALELHEAFEKLVDTPAFHEVLENPAFKTLLETPEFQAVLDKAAG